MGDNLHLGSLIFFAIVVVFLAFRLRSVLGRRTGNERPRPGLGPMSFRAPPQPQSPPPGPGPVIEGTATPVATAAPAQPMSLAEGVQRLKSVDRSFDERIFLQGARGAFEIIVNAFAAADTQALKPLLSEEVYRSFAEAITQRQAAKETHETNLLSVKTVDLVEAGVSGSTASATVKFISDQVNVTRAADGAVVDGDPDQVVEKTDFWTFARDIRSRDPNWQLVATRST
ncbi:MAG TPA: Tim44/TimA family putative adaptor protein [Stellaceae bacterium]|nr:Tim44/TimA family putative adaptor protein [Stellaceae bacterium]